MTLGEGPSNKEPDIANFQIPIDEQALLRIVQVCEEDASNRALSQERRAAAVLALETIFSLTVIED